MVTDKTPTSKVPTITPAVARRLAVMRQRLAGPSPAPDADGLLETARDLGCVQLDPISVVEKSHRLVWFSRVGPYDRAHLDRLLWEERQLFEYWAHCASLVLTEDYPIHYHLMRYYPGGRHRGSTWADNTRAWDFFDRYRLPRQHRLIDARSTLGDDAVDRHFLAGTDTQCVAGVHVGKRNVLLGLVRSNAPSGLRLQTEQRTNGGRCLRTGAQLEHLTEQRQRHDNRRCFEVDRDATHFSKFLGEETGRYGSKNAIEIRRRDADSDQRPHVGTAMANGIEASDEEWPARP
jgi:hypothetical protein